MTKTKQRYENVVLCLQNSKDLLSYERYIIIIWKIDIFINNNLRIAFAYMDFISLMVTYKYATTQQTVN